VEAALSAPLAFEIVNLGGSHPVTLAELVAALEKATGRRARLERQPDQPGDVPVTYAAVDKAKRLLGFEARVPLEEGLRRAVAWYRETSGHDRIGTREA
jgi:UDP-glucuronate 4-epimerase